MSTGGYIVPVGSKIINRANYFRSWLGMLVRCALAALDFNFNIGREQKIGPDGNPMFKMRVSRIISSQFNPDDCSA